VIFNSLEFAVFLPTVLIVYWLLPHRLQNLLLVAASYAFYAAWDYRFLGLLVVSTGTDYAVGLGLGRARSNLRRKLLLAFSLVVNLGILGFFKYANFFVESATDLLSSTGVEANPHLLGVILPVGISFYTFQTLSYTFDVYRREVEPCHDLAAFAAYVAFFPQLVAGPIERAGHLLPQMRQPRRRPTRPQITSALHLIGAGLLKKVVLADGVAPFADRSFADPSGPTLALWVGALAFAIQIYGDFSGYTDIARGSARLLGIDLMENFRQPYLSRNITEFWQRWHISLSSWLRDYLYIPLGGNRGGRLNTYRNLLVTMLLGGLWHGAGWTFVIWGVIHGLWLAGHRWLREVRSTPDSDELRLRDAPRILMTFVTVTLVWVPFRAKDFGTAIDYVSGMFSLHAGAPSADALTLVAAGALAVLATDVMSRERHARPVVMPAPIRGLAYGGSLVLLVVFSGSESVPFIYFQF
jgi:alginate O-acetyltransferase complex protein AlgI